ncbi:NAD(P)-dependent oxidoreductase [Sporomusa acidovorans]|uniref:2-hydroxy-3-oxopropionate reductase n=1 Tax=Sporomusa acidovorans (strain ATCC 49682 / DSM 3132 / Mol) TaxID=1123286 RepID=A0ABZ3J7F0_SPOA4|nr:NAD(P)-dependent oxidoreductase [Sporomusa acidovorans]OZC21264.1 2-hydroxy-3-oxopropionate reductase [Sporomusa acidovorans DSM 3132]SDE66383.1 3-hydroxyisobutyrate dehydrogenase [Sporomusa acidovorans]
MKIGYIGLGLMGGPLARNLIRAGQNVLVYDLNNDAIARTLAAGTTGSAAAKAEDMADCDVIFTSLPLPVHIKEVMMSEHGLLTKMKQGSIYIDVSTIDPTTAEEIENFAKARGVGFVGCPLGKGPAQAEKAEEPIFAGGDKATFEKVLPILNRVGAPVHYLGGVKQAYAFKVISNMIGMTNLAVLAEGLHLGNQAGIDAKQFLELLAETGANSFQLQVRGPWIVNNDFANRFGVSLALKDVRLGCEMADSWGYDARFTKQAKKFYEQAEQKGLGREDCNAVYKVL